MMLVASGYDLWNGFSHPSSHTLFSLDADFEDEIDSGDSLKWVVTGAFPASPIATKGGLPKKLVTQEYRPSLPHIHNRSTHLSARGNLFGMKSIQNYFVRAVC